MKTLVVYVSNRGYTRECAQQIAAIVGSGSIAVEVGREAAAHDIADYEAVILGAGIHAGRLSGKFRSWCAKHTQELLKTKLGLFICANDEANQEKLFEANYPPELLKHAMARGYLGGRIIMSDYNFIIKAILKRIAGSGDDVHLEKPDNVKALAAQFA